MLRAGLRLVLALMLAASPAVRAEAQVSPSSVTDPEVALGIRHVDEGDYDAARSRTWMAAS